MDVLYSILSVIFGLTIGSFLNVVIFRFSQKSMNVFHPARSICLHCKKSILWYDNIPLLSYFLLKGKCRFCHTKISCRYPVIEGVTGGLFLLNFFSFPSLLALIGANVLVASLIVVFFTDLDTMMISDWSTAFVILGSGLIYLDHGLTDSSIFLMNAITAVIAFSLIFLIRLLFRVTAKKDAMGMVDIVLISVLALPLGPMKINLSIFLACLAGIIAALFFRKKMQDKIPFGPFIAIGGYLSLVFGDQILNTIGFISPF